MKNLYRLLILASLLTATGRLTAQDLVIEVPLIVSPVGVLTAGSVVSVTITVKNDSTVAARKSVVAVLLRPGAWGSRFNKLDAHLGSRPILPLGPGGDQTITLDVRIPYGTPTEPCWLGAYADIGCAVAESREDNNYKALSRNCKRYTGKECRIGWVRAFYPSVEEDRHWPRVGGLRASQIAVTAPRVPRGFYVLVWSGSPIFNFDIYSWISLTFSYPVFIRWQAWLNDEGRAHAVLAMPDITPFAPPIDAWVHGFFFRIDSRGRFILDCQSNPIRTRVR